MKNNNNLALMLAVSGLLVTVEAKKDANHASGLGLLIGVVVYSAAVLSCVGYGYYKFWQQEPTDSEGLEKSLLANQADNLESQKGTASDGFVGASELLENSVFSSSFPAGSAGNGEASSTWCCC